MKGAATLSWRTLGLLGPLLIAAGCSRSTADHPSGASSTGPALAGKRAKTVAAAPCQDWTTRACGVELGRHDGVVDCAHGVQLCQNGQYGACVPDAALGVVSVAAPAAVLPKVPQSGLMSIGGTATSCADDVCNPFCQRFEDVPDEPYESERVDVPTGDLSGGTVDSSNLPSGFKNKGSLDAQCSSPQGSQSWNEACQFDQHCVSGACTSFQAGEYGDCTGVDITTPTTCVPETDGYRVLTVCNRGTLPAAAGIRCFGYSGGSPKFPNDNPGTTDRLIMTTATVLAAGACESQQIDEDIFHQNGIQSVGCNPPESTLVTVSLSALYPSSNATTSGLLAWTSPENGGWADSVFASASPANPNGASSGPFSPSANAAFASDFSWTGVTNAYSSTPANSFATATLTASGVSSGTVGPRYAGSFTNPASAGDLSFTAPDQIYSADGSNVTATPSNPNTIISTTGSPSGNDGLNWSNHSNAYTSNAIYATRKLTGAGTSDTVLSNFGLSVPSNAVLDALEVRVKWKTDVNSVRYQLSAQAMTGAASTLVGASLAKSGTYTVETTDLLTVPAATLLSFSATDFSDANFKVRLRFSRSNGGVADSTASVDHVQVVLKYHLPSSTASVVYRSFGLGSIPSGATLQMTAEVKWKTSVVNSNVVLGMQLYKNWGSAGQAAIGSELTRTPVLANTNYVDTTPTLTPTTADLADASFAVRLRVVRGAGATNPDVTASIDYIRVTVNWTLGDPSNTHSAYLTGFGLDRNIPASATITSLSTTASWKVSAPTAGATLGVQAYKAGGGTALGSEVTNTTNPTILTSTTQTLATGVTRSDLSDANFGVRVRASRATTSPNFTASLDHVTVTVGWTAPSVGHGVTYGTFGLGSIPADATVTQLKTEVRWKTSVASTRAQLAFQAFKAGGVAVGSELVDSSVPTSATVRTQTLTGLALSPADLVDGSFVVKVRATRSSGTSNPDFTASLDYVRVTATYQRLVSVSVAECNGSNNWTATKLNPSPDGCEDMGAPQYVPFTVTRVFQGLCPDGQGPVWRRAGYTTTTPAGTSVEFRFRSFAADADGTCTALAAITSGDPQPLATASPTQDPAVCTTTDPSCVLDLNANLGGSSYAKLECVQMDAYGIPAGAESPQLHDWTVLYDCLDNE